MSHLSLRYRRGRLAQERRPAVIHPIRCRCARCNPHRAAEQLRAANHWARHTFIGLGLGLAAAKGVDLFVGGPGILSIFGVTL